MMQGLFGPVDHTATPPPTPLEEGKLCPVVRHIPSVIITGLQE